MYGCIRYYIFLLTFKNNALIQYYNVFFNVFVIWFKTRSTKGNEKRYFRFWGCFVFSLNFCFWSVLRLSYCEDERMNQNNKRISQFSQFSQFSYVYSGLNGLNEPNGSAFRLNGWENYVPTRTALCRIWFALGAVSYCLTLI